LLGDDADRRRHGEHDDQRVPATDDGTHDDEQLAILVVRARRRFHQRGERRHHRRAE